MCLDQLCAKVNPNQGPIATHINLFTHILCRHRVESGVEADVVIRMYFAASPAGNNKPFRLERNQGDLLFGFENLQRDAACSPVNSPSRHLTTPDKRPSGNVLQVDKGLALEKALSGKGDVAFHGRFVFCMIRTRRIGEESPEGGVFEKGAVESRRIGIIEIQAGFQPVHDDSLRAAVEEAEGFLEAVNHRLEVLAENGNKT